MSCRRASPASTLSGVPKIPRTMAIIDELEPMQRGPKGARSATSLTRGTWIPASQSCRSRATGRRASVQVGVGIVADSDPKSEWLETCSKARGMVLALRMAWGEDDEIMSVRHHRNPVEGVQFHPESVLTIEGKRLLRNFLCGPG